jgi:hypothetical protein
MTNAMTHAANSLSTKTYSNGVAPKVLGAIAAVAATLVLQGTLLTGFDHLAARSAVDAAAATQMATLPAVTVVHKRG